MPEIPEYIERRLRTPAPWNACVIRGSTPVLSFGALTKAHVATVGLNPSRVEFLDRDGRELQGSSRRLSTLSSLGTNDLIHAPTSILSQVVGDCEMYFSRNPYRRWFDQLEYILQGVGASYYDGSSCHLDLVQWATDPPWKRLDRVTRLRLMEADASFLKDQLRSENLRLLLVNGVSVAKQFQKALDVELTEELPIKLNGITKARIWTATAFHRVSVVAWSSNIQSSHGVSSEFRKAFRDRVATFPAARMK